MATREKNTSCDTSGGLNQTTINSNPSMTRARIQGSITNMSCIVSRKSMVSPEYMLANSTSHVRIFGAIAELIDNAIDARPLKGQLVMQIDKSKINDQDCIVFTDNGCGMSTDELHRMLSFGYTKSKRSGASKIGRYGNGFKSGSMRIGDDVLVLTTNGETCSIGMFSKTYHRNTGADELMLPIVTFNKEDKFMKKMFRDDLQAIVDHSIFKSLEEILSEFEDFEKNIDSETGTRIIITNLKVGQNGKPELDFDSEPLDVINSEHCESDSSVTIGVHSKESRLNESKSIPKYHTSLREYCSILYSEKCFKPGLRIMLRGRMVIGKDIKKRLRRQIEKKYLHRQTEVSVTITFGFSPKEEDYYGLMMYHKDRFIKCQKIGCQTRATGEGVGVVGVVEVGQLLDPIQNKQDFVRDDTYKVAMRAFGTKLNEYWEEKKDKSTSERDCVSPTKSAGLQKESKKKMPKNLERKLRKSDSEDISQEITVKNESDNAERYISLKRKGPETQVQEDDIVVISSEDELDSNVESNVRVIAGPSGLHTVTNILILESGERNITISKTNDKTDGLLEHDNNSTVLLPAFSEATNTISNAIQKSDDKSLPNLPALEIKHLANAGRESNNNPGALERIDPDVEEDESPLSPSILTPYNSSVNAIITNWSEDSAPDARRATVIADLQKTIEIQHELSPTTNAKKPGKSSTDDTHLNSSKTDSVSLNRCGASEILSARALRSGDKMPSIPDSAIADSNCYEQPTTTRRSNRTSPANVNSTSKNFNEVAEAIVADIVKTPSQMRDTQCRASSSIKNSVDVGSSVDRRRLKGITISATKSRGNKSRKPKLLVLPNPKTSAGKNALNSRSFRGNDKEKSGRTASNVYNEIDNDELPDLNSGTIKITGSKLMDCNSNISSKSTKSKCNSIQKKRLSSQKHDTERVAMTVQPLISGSEANKQIRTINRINSPTILINQSLIVINPTINEEANAEPQPGSKGNARRELVYSHNSPDNKSTKTTKRKALDQVVSEITQLRQPGLSELNSSSQAKRQKVSENNREIIDNPPQLDNINTIEGIVPICSDVAGVDALDIINITTTIGQNKPTHDAISQIDSLDSMDDTSTVDVTAMIDNIVSRLSDCNEREASSNNERSVDILTNLQENEDLRSTADVISSVSSVNLVENHSSLSSTNLSTMGASFENNEQLLPIQIISACETQNEDTPSGTTSSHLNTSTPIAQHKNNSVTISYQSIGTSTAEYRENLLPLPPITMSTSVAVCGENPTSLLHINSSITETEHEKNSTSMVHMNIVAPVAESEKHPTSLSHSNLSTSATERAKNLTLLSDTNIATSVIECEENLTILSHTNIATSVTECERNQPILSEDQLIHDISKSSQRYDCVAASSQLSTLNDTLQNLRRNILTLFQLQHPVWLECRQVNEENLQEIDSLIIKLIDIFKKNQKS